MRESTQIHTHTHPIPLLPDMFMHGILPEMHPVFEQISLYNLQAVSIIINYSTDASLKYSESEAHSGAPGAKPAKLIRFMSQFEYLPFLCASYERDKTL